MSEITSFAPGVAKELDYYVYRLIDPRNGETFYVGKGRGDRVFQHVRAALQANDDEDALSLKLKTIRDIIDEGLEVIHVIHRHGMDEATAFEVEAALLDVYPGLTNIQGGHGSLDRGPMNAKQINNLYAAQELTQSEMAQAHSVIIKIRSDTVEAKGGDIYKTVRYAWKIGDKTLGKLNATPDHLILAVINGIVKGVYQNAKWKKVEDGVANGRYEFDADEAAQTIQAQFMGKLIDGQYRKRGLANPVLLTW
ncbi:MAG: hypothetical protein K5841_02805 [Fretibacterium sp.]|nr:hypothetical protein [Fretibacterium sp.]